MSTQARIDKLNRRLKERATDNDLDKIKQFLAGIPPELKKKYDIAELPWNNTVIFGGEWKAYRQEQLRTADDREAKTKELDETEDKLGNKIMILNLCDKDGKRIIPG